MTEDIHAGEVVRWAEAIAGIGRTGLAFTENPYDRERYEELLAVAGDMLATVALGEGAPAEERVTSWLQSVVNGPRGYATPKVAVGAFVGNERGEILLIQRSDSHRWFIPTGWADIGYSAAEVVVKEVHEETGIDVTADRLVMAFDGMRAGSPIPHYTLVFSCTPIGGELLAHPQECDDVGWFAEDALPEPLFWGDFWRERAFAAIRGERGDVWFDPPRQPVWRNGVPE